MSSELLINCQLVGGQRIAVAVRMTDTEGQVIEVGDVLRDIECIEMDAHT